MLSLLLLQSVTAHSQSGMGNEHGHEHLPDVLGCYENARGNLSYVFRHKHKTDEFYVQTESGVKCKLFNCHKQGRNAVECKIQRKCPINGGETVTFEEKNTREGDFFEADRLLGGPYKQIHGKQAYKCLWMFKKPEKDYSGCYYHKNTHSGNDEMFYTYYKRHGDYYKHDHKYDYDVYFHDGKKCKLEHCKLEFPYGMHCYYHKNCHHLPEEKVNFYPFHYENHKHKNQHKIGHRFYEEYFGQEHHCNSFKPKGNGGNGGSRRGNGRRRNNGGNKGGNNGNLAEAPVEPDFMGQNANTGSNLVQSSSALQISAMTLPILFLLA